MSSRTTQRNWSGNYEYRAAAIHHPATLGQVRRLAASALSLHALGSRHSFTGIADAGELVSLDRLGPGIAVHHDSGTVSVPAATTYAELADELNRAGLALPNLASLPHLSVAGAVATATHGSGERLGNLATSVVGLEMITSSGDVLSARRGDDDFDGLVVGLGVLGIVIRLTLAVEPFYEISQRVYNGLEWEALFSHFDEIMGSGESVSVFHRLGARTEQVWVKRRAPAGDWPRDLFGAVPRGPPEIPLPARTPSTARPSSAKSDGGQSACRTFAPGSCPARARRSSPRCS